MPWDDDVGSEFDLSEGLDPEGPSAEDLDRFGDELSRCPSCGNDIYDQAELCHVCGYAIERESTRPPTWVVAVAVVVILALLWIVL